MCPALFSPPQREPFECTLLNFRKDGSPVMNNLYITPLYSDPRRPALATHFAGVIRLRPADLTLGPLPLKPSRWLPDTLAGSQASLPVPASWNAGASERDDKDWLAEMGDRELSHLLGFLNFSGLAACAATCRRMRRLVESDAVWSVVCGRLWHTGDVASLERPARSLGWKRVAREIFTLEALHWRRLRVGGAVSPVRTNFSTCGLGDRVFIFGGEGADASAYNDLFVLDLGRASPCWQLVDMPPDATKPRGRWGHTLRELGSTAMVLFGGSSADGPVNDVFILDASRWPPTWREVHVSPQPSPVPRSWHGACTLSGKELLIFGGCSAAGKLLSDTWRLNLLPDAQDAWPQWEELSCAWTPPARLGLSLVATEEGRVFAFGGLASAGPVRLRSQDAFTLDLRSSQPTWHYVTGSQLPSGAAAAGTPPPPRLEQVAGTLIGGRVLVFGGSVNGGSDAAVTRAWEPYVMSPNSETPTWRRLRVTGAGPRDAWGYSTCMLGTHRFILAGKYDAGVLDMNELHELSLLSEPAWLAPNDGGDSGEDDSRGSNTAHEAVFLTAAPAATDTGDPSALCTDPGAAGAVVSLDPNGNGADAAAGRGAAPGGEDDDSGHRSPGDEEASLQHPGMAQLRGGFGGSGGTSSEDDTRTGVMRMAGPSAAAAAQHQQHGVMRMDEPPGGDPAQESWLGQSRMQVQHPRAQPLETQQQQEEQSHRVGAFPGLRPSALFPAFPVLPLMASGARLLTQLKSVVTGGGDAGASSQGQAVWSQDRSAPEMRPGDTAGAPGALPSAPAPGAAGWPVHAYASDEERQRRRRSLTGRGVEHPRPNVSSGSDEEGPLKAHRSGEEDTL